MLDRISRAPIQGTRQYPVGQFYNAESERPGRTGKKSLGRLRRDGFVEVNYHDGSRTHITERICSVLSQPFLGTTKGQDRGTSTSVETV